VFLCLYAHLYVHITTYLPTYFAQLLFTCCVILCYVRLSHILLNYCYCYISVIIPSKPLSDVSY